MRRPLLGVMALGALGIAGAMGYEVSRAKRSREVLLVVTGEVRGRDRRCGCQGAAGPSAKVNVPVFSACACKLKIVEVDKKLPDLGALPERSAWLAQQRAQLGRAVQLDVGDLLFPRLAVADVDRADWEARAALLVQGYGILGVHAYEPGEIDLALGREALTRLLGKARFAVVSSNLRDAKTHAPLFPGRAIVTPEPGSSVRVGVVGVFDPPASDELQAVLAREGLEVADPAACVAPEVEALRKEGVDLVVLLAHASDASTRALVRKVNGIDLAFASHAEVPTDSRNLVEGRTAVALPLRGGGAPICARVSLTPGARGVVDAGVVSEARVWIARLEKQLADEEASRAQATDEAGRKAIDQEIAWTKQKLAEERAAIPAEPRHEAEVVAVALDAHVYDHGQDAELQAAINGFKSEVKDRTLPADVQARLEAAGKTPDGRVLAFRTEVQCAQCHAKQAAVWEKSPHAKAWAALERAHDEKDPDCVRCHTIGWRAPGGFADVGRVVRKKGEGEEKLGSADQLDFRNVQCEACHGARAAHPDSHAVGIDIPTLDTCRKCHDPEHDPWFGPDRIENARQRGVRICTRS